MPERIDVKAFRSYTDIKIQKDVRWNFENPDLVAGVKLDGFAGENFSGFIVYADELGIYGNTVMIDHGMGVVTLYGHMSTIDVNEGNIVEKGDIIGRTGETGLAAGDHLHYGIYINGVAVRPIEWWDKKWINDNVVLKINQASGELGETATDETQTQN